jgi:ubiquinone/menaquinone biosynthesis C-methylase UbiE
LRKKSADHYTKFAQYYDTIYNEIVDYEAQASYIEKIFEKFHNGKVSSVLDIGCGTGNYTFLFAKRGYETTGIDISSDMIGVAKSKLKLAKEKTSLPEFYNMDMRDITLESRKKRYDAATVLFGGFGYLLENDDTREFFNSAKKNLNKDGLLIFEFWHVSGVSPQSSTKSGHLSWVKVEDGDRVIVRLDASKYDALTNTIRVLFDFYVMDRKAKQFLDSFTETHVLKTYSISQIRDMLEESGFKPLAFLKDTAGLDGEIEDAAQSSFRVLAVARVEQ